MASSSLELQLDHRQMASDVRHFGKNILITDREDWDARRKYMKPTAAGESWRPKAREVRPTASGPPAGARPESHAVTLMPLYHWTGSKIRVHLFVCVAAMTYLALLCQRLSGQGFHLAPREALDELRSLRTAIYQEKSEGKLKRIVEPVSNRQSAILRAMGYQVRDGKILPL